MDIFIQINELIIKAGLEKSILTQGKMRMIGYKLASDTMERRQAMEKEKSRSDLLLAVFGMIFVFLMICMNTRQYDFSEEDVPQSFTDHLPLLVLNFSFFLCALSLQAGDILRIVKERKSLQIRWELIILSLICFLLGFVKYLQLLFPSLTQYDGIQSLIGMMTANVFFAHYMDIVFLLISGVMFVQSFRVDHTMARKDEDKKYLVIYVFLIIFVILENYIKAFALINAKRWNMPLLIFTDILTILIASLVVQAENLLPAFKRKKNLIIDRRFIALSMVSLCLVFIKIWAIWTTPKNTIMEFFNDIAHSLLWAPVYTFAVGIFLAHAFRIRPDHERKLSLVDDER